MVLEILKQKRIGKSCHKLQLFKKYPYARGNSFHITSEPATTIKTLNKQENINQNREGLDSIFFFTITGAVFTAQGALTPCNDMLQGREFDWDG